MSYFNTAEQPQLISSKFTVRIRLRSYRNTKDPIMKLLVVDDNQETRAFICDLLNPYGHQVLESENGTEAVTKYKIEKPDFVLMDYEMPEMDGITAAKTIISDYPDARIFIVTMFDDMLLRTAANKAGVERFILKENLTDLPGLLNG